jgi:outer membrane lipoprotein-sorting protein
VFKKLLQAERQVLGVEAQRKAALNRINYDFELTGQEKTPSGLTYVLRMSPKRKDTFLCRGRIWVDAKDFAVIRLEAEPAKNPSFWTKTSEIERIYEKVGVFWLPSSNTSGP